MSVTHMIPSGSTNGLPVKIAASATPGTLFHTADPVALDDIYMSLTNTDTVDHTVTVEFGGPTAPDDNIKFIVPAGDTIPAIMGVPLTNSLTVKAFCDTANKVNMFGYVNRNT